jgi:hypothetical protein
MQFADYYKSLFRMDLESVMRAAPPSQHRDAAEVMIQPRTLSSENGVIRRWPAERRALFGAAVFLTVLADQVCYTHFQALYPQFRSLTQYPKFHGDCPGACSHHIHPENVFRCLGSSTGSRREPNAFPYTALPAGTLGSIQAEITAFVRDHLPELGDEFWSRCEIEIPAELRSIKP